MIDDVRLKGTFRRNEKTEIAVRELLDNRAVLQYVNDDEWYAVNPLIDGLKNPVVAASSK